jgi:hypothetical protein
MFENRLPRIMLGTMRQEVTGNQRKLLSKELHNLCTLPIIIRVITLKKTKSEGHVAYLKRNPFKILVRKPEGKSQPGRCRHRWKDNIKIP